MDNIAFVFGTRPEAIKMAPVIKEAEKSKFKPLVIVTAQHRQMLDQVLEVFNINPHYDLNIMIPKQSLFDVTNSTLTKIKPILEKEKPKAVVVQGDTTTTFASALSSFYLKIPVGHIEAGLRTGDVMQPYPEEINRILTSNLSSFHFTPTNTSKNNLLKEGFSKNIYVTGNTVIDALLFISKTINAKENKNKILVTLHRRENWGKPAEDVCKSLKRIANETDLEIIFSVHPNPAVRKTVNSILNDVEQIKLIEPADYINFVKLMKESYFILSDSGGIQEEAPSLNKPVLVLRNKTERPEALESGAVKLVGTDPDKIYKTTIKLFNNDDFYNKLANATNPFGDGTSSKSIIKILENNLSS